MPDLIFASVTQNSITAPAAFACTAAALVMGVCIALIHMHRSACSKSFAVTLALLPAMVQIVITLVNGNLGAGVAVAGAFSLVRFRSVPGSAGEIGSIFFAMAIGLACGLGYLAYAALFLLLVGGALLALTALRFGEPKHTERELRVTIPESLDYEGIFDDLFQKYTRRAELERVRTTNMGSLYELCYRVDFRESTVSREFLDAIRCRNGNLNIVCGRMSNTHDEL